MMQIQDVKIQLLSLTSNLHLSILIRPFSLTYRYISIVIRTTFLLQYSYINIVVISFSISPSLFIHSTRNADLMDLELVIFSCAEERNYWIQWNICGENILHIYELLWNSSNSIKTLQRRNLLFKQKDCRSVLYLKVYLFRDSYFYSYIVQWHYLLDTLINHLIMYVPL